MSLEAKVADLVKKAVASNPAVLDRQVLGIENIEETPETLAALDAARVALIQALFDGLYLVAGEVDRLRAELEIPPL